MIESAVKKNCRDPGLNQGPSDLQSDALPTELSRRYFPKSNKAIGMLSLTHKISQHHLFRETAYSGYLQMIIC